MMTFSRSALSVAFALTLLSCQAKKPQPSSSLSPVAKLGVDAQALATVNGVPISADDVRRESAVHMQKEEPNPERARGVLESVIRDELAYQEALKLGLDADASYQREARRLDADLHAAKRRLLADVFYRKQSAKNADFSDAELHKYFDEHAAELQREVHVFQILTRDETRINDFKKRIEQGAAFEEVAASMFPNAGLGDRKPWDLGYLGFSQIPEAWRAELQKLGPGQTSGVIRGPNERFWIIKLVERRERAQTFEQSKSEISSILKSQKLEAFRQQMTQQLRASAHIEYRTPGPNSSAKSPSGVEASARVMPSSGERLE
jgi:parvulin-like peptidyl-prolyl isomerase